MILVPMNMTSWPSDCDYARTGKYRSIQLIFAVALLIAVTALDEVRAAEVSRLVFYSAALHQSKNITMVLPDDYSTNLIQRHYPVVYFLNGYLGNDRTFLDGTSLPQLVDQYKIIAACPDGGTNSWYFDSPIYPEHKYETFIWCDSVKYVDEHYRTIEASTGRGITGLSMGGHGAMYIGLRHPEVFGAIASMSGGLDIRPFPDNWDLKQWFGDPKTHADNWENNTVINLLDQVKLGGQAIYFDCGTNDFFLRVNRAVHAKMNRLGFQHKYEEFPGGHTMDYWRPATVRHMFFFENFFGIATQKPAASIPRPGRSGH